MAERSSTSSREGSTNEKSPPEFTHFEETFNYDHILEHLGQMGKYQLHTFLWLCLPAIFPGMIIMSYTFTGGIPDYRCFIEGCDDSANSSETNLFKPSWLNNTIPWNENNSPDQCYHYNNTWLTLDECQEPGGIIDLEMVKSCDRWVYDKSLFASTIVMEFDLTCGDEWKQTFASSVYMFGMLIGAATLGNIADAIGRRLAFTFNAFLMATVTTCLAFSPNFATFCVLRFLCGASAVGHFLILFVWGVEAVGMKYRVMVGFIYQLMFSVGSALMGLVAYYIRDWKTLQLVISVPMFALVGIYWILPESIRWLISKQRYQEARDLILKVSKINKKIVPLNLILIPDGNISTVADISSMKQNDATIDGHDWQQVTQSKNKQRKESILEVFRSLVLVKRLVIMFFAWIAVVMGYYGITFSVTNLSENFFLNYELAMIVEFPAYIGGIFIIGKIGCRPTLSGGLILSGIACLITGLVPEENTTVRVTFSMIGKFFISCVLATVFSFTSDLFPTPARSAAVGLCSTSGRIGGILAPIIANAGRKLDPALPFIIFAIINIIVGMLCLLLPETRQRPLPRTVQEAEDLEKYTISWLQCTIKEGSRPVDRIK